MMSSENKRVLVVDDDDSARELLTYLLTKAGYDVCEAFDGIDALDLLCSRRLEAVVTDYRMPRLNGVQLRAICRKLWPGLPVVLLSADAAPEADSISAEQPNVWLRKPYNTADLLRAVKAACGSASVSKGNAVATTTCAPGTVVPLWK